MHPKRSEERRVPGLPVRRDGALSQISIALELTRSTGVLTSASPRIEE
jgi:hypothetical protein